MKPYSCTISELCTGQSSQHFLLHRLFRAHSGYICHETFSFMMSLPAMSFGNRFNFLHLVAGVLVPALQLSSMQFLSCMQQKQFMKVIHRIHNTSDDALFQEMCLLAQSLAVFHKYMLLYRVPVQRHILTGNVTSDLTHQFFTTRSFIPLCIQDTTANSVMLVGFELA